MADTAKAIPETVTATTELTVGGRPLRLEMVVPTGLTTPQRLLPLFQSVTDSFVEVAVATVERDGSRVSCRKGCGACCRQLVPVSHIEARQLRDFVAHLPEPRRLQLLARFARARERLEESGLLQRLRQSEGLRPDEMVPLGLEYFSLGLACPFLDEESCSIYSERPLACREYLVVSPAANCAAPTAATVQRVPMPAEPARATRCFNDDGSDSNRWVPLILALEWADGHLDEPPARPGPDLVRSFFARLTGHDIPPPSP